jgi:CRISPR-associated protein Cmr6
VDLIAPFRLNENLRKDWKALLQDAFKYAFDWLGFGAKTAVGYGAMKGQEETWENATVKYDAGRRVMTATWGDKKAEKAEAKALFEKLGSKKRQDKAKSGELKLTVRIRIQDDKLELMDVLPPPA